MALTGKHTFGSIGETRVTFVEKGVDENRRDFLKKLLEHNGFDVITEEEKRKSDEDPQLYTVAVTDMVFNPTIWVFERKLKTFDGHKVTQDFWNQKHKVPIHIIGITEKNNLIILNGYFNNSD